MLRATHQGRRRVMSFRSKSGTLPKFFALRSSHRCCTSLVASVHSNFRDQQCTRNKFESAKDLSMGAVAASLAAASAAAAAAASADSFNCNRKPVQCDMGSRGVASRETEASTLRRVGVSPGRVVRCEAVVRQGPGESFSIVTLDVERDRPGLLNEATELLKRYDLNITDAKISTKDGSDGARHVYTVQNKTTRKGLSVQQLETLRLALETLGEVDCTAKAWPIYTQEDVAQHKTKDTGIWVSYKNGVYDITEFIENHPGGTDKIMLAAGRAIDPFWRIYQQHEGRGNALLQLEKLRIGDLADPPPVESGSDPYDADPERHPGLIFHNNKPCNAELPAELMLDAWLTPNPVWFIRHHHPVPVVDPDAYRLIVEGTGTKPVRLTLEDLRTRFLKREVVSTIQCGGNRRSELDKVEKTSGIPWGFGAVSTAKWGGVSLREVLQYCGGLSIEGVLWGDTEHVVFHGIDDMQASIPVEKAMSPFGDVLLAYEMNGETLPAEHGFPVRVVVPGVVGVRNVKWLSRIQVSPEEAQGPWQRGIAYKGFSPMIKDFKDVDVEKVQSVQEMPVQSSIVYPKNGATITLDSVEVKGFAWSGGGRGIVRVDVSLDGGSTWTTAELKDGSEQHPTRAWAWTFWEADVPVPDALRGKPISILCRATDVSYNTQPERPEPIWNLRGLNCNCWHRVAVNHDDSD